MEGESKTPVASASDAGGQSEAGARRAEAGASIAGCWSLSALPAEEAVFFSSDLVRWSVYLIARKMKRQILYTYQVRIYPLVL